MKKNVVVMLIATVALTFCVTKVDAQKNSRSYTAADYRRLANAMDSVEMIQKKYGKELALVDSVKRSEVVDNKKINDTTNTKANNDSLPKNKEKEMVNNSNNDSLQNNDKSKPKNDDSSPKDKITTVDTFVPNPYCNSYWAGSGTGFFTPYMVAPRYIDYYPYYGFGPSLSISIGCGFREHFTGYGYESYGPYSYDYVSSYNNYYPNTGGYGYSNTGTAYGVGYGLEQSGSSYGIGKTKVNNNGGEKMNNSGFKKNYANLTERAVDVQPKVRQGNNSPKLNLSSPERGNTSTPNPYYEAMVKKQNQKNQPTNNQDQRNVQPRKENPRNEQSRNQQKDLARKERPNNQNQPKQQQFQPQQLRYNANQQNTFASRGGSAYGGGVRSSGRRK